MSSLDTPLHSLSSYDYALPQELIAQYPAEPRDSSRLMIVNRASGTIQTAHFRDLFEILKQGDRLIFNDTKVVPARLIGRRKNGGMSELFLIKKLTNDSWRTLVRPGRKLRIGTTIHFSPELYAEITAIEANGERIVQFHSNEDLHLMLQKYGQVPLPHYIRRHADEQDHASYQTVYAKIAGALAVPAAGLHFTQELLQAIISKGVESLEITLHTGLGTFVPVKSADIRQHTMHRERAIILPDTAEKLSQRHSGKLNICVGTTCCRALETAAAETGTISSGEYDTDIFIYPGYRFKYVQQLLTNFHAPRSTLLMLVSAFAGYDLTMRAYEMALKERFRFLTYGDAMLIL